MRKSIFALCYTMLMIFTLTNNAYGITPSLAAFNELYNTSDETYQELTDFEITSGLMKESEGTFDDTRTIIGSAPKGTKVYIGVYKYDAQEEAFILVGEESVVVGLFGGFSKDIKLDLGENFIFLSGTNGTNRFVKTALIKRKKLEIKHELERGIVLPKQFAGNETGSKSN